MKETWISRRMLYEGKVFDVVVGEARLEDGTIVPREAVVHSGGVGIVPVLDGCVLLVRQYRIATGGWVLELPAGRLEVGEDPEKAARRELEEETGYRASRMEHVASCYCSPGFTNEKDHLYLAFGLLSVGQRLEFDERIEVVHMPLNEAWAKLDAHAFDDGKTIIGLRELQVYLALHADALLD